MRFVFPLVPCLTKIDLKRRWCYNRHSLKYSVEHNETVTVDNIIRIDKDPSKPLMCFHKDSIIDKNYEHEGRLFVKGRHRQVEGVGLLEGGSRKGVRQNGDQKCDV